jgi:hypothetical protein
MKSLARSISSFGHPVLLFPLVLGLLLRVEGSWSVALVVFALAFGGPFIYFLWLYFTHRVSDFDISDRRQRYGVYAVSLLGMFLTGIYLFFAGSGWLFMEFLKLFALALVLVALNFKVKVSIHVALITVLTLFAVQFYAWAPWVMLLVFPMMWSRWKLKRHTLLEIALGFGVPLLFYTNVWWY